MPKIVIATDDGVPFKQFDTADWNLNHPAARVSLMHEMVQAIERAADPDARKAEALLAAQVGKFTISLGEVQQAMRAAGYCDVPVRDLSGPLRGALCGDALPCETHGEAERG